MPKDPFKAGALRLIQIRDFENSLSCPLEKNRSQNIHFQILTSLMILRSTLWWIKLFETLNQLNLALLNYSVLKCTTCFRSELRCGFVNLLIQIGTSKHVSQIFWFRSELQSMYHKSFDSNQNFKAPITNLLIQIRTSKHVSQIFWFKSELQSMYHKSFDSDRNFKARISNLLIQIRTSKRLSQTFWFRSELQSAYHKYFYSDRIFKAWITNI